MAENLNYAGSGTTIGVCYNNSADSCTKYGRLYAWAEVMGLATSYNTTTWGGSDVKHQGICPTGWHVPSDAEWTTMQQVVDASNTADGTKLKSASGWSTNTGTDTYDFRALPGGYGDSGSSDDAGNNGDWWSATEGNAFYAWFRGMYYDYARVVRGNDIKTNGFSLRCTKD